MKTPSNQMLLKAKSIIDQSFGRRSLHQVDKETGQVKYCALGAIGRVYEEDDFFDYMQIPAEDTIVLACAIDKKKVQQAINNLEDGLNGMHPDQIWNIVTDFNDDTNQKAVAEKFKEACKDYNKHWPMVEKYHAAEKAWMEQRHGRNRMLRWEYLKDEKTSETS